MVANSKVLTVSYGTFSCTLEGFDESFDTMKAIAEYFRDLAGEDRYFGAEPPSPDAEMLARIAEKEIARRVDAREERGSIVLRAVDPEPEPVQAAPKDAKKDPAVVGSEGIPVVANVVAAVSASMAADKPAALTEPSAAIIEPVAEHIAVEPTVETQQAVEATSEVAAPVEKTAPVLETAVLSKILAEDALEDDAQDNAEPEVLAAEPELVAETVVEPVAEIEPAAPAYEEPEDSVAAKLQRIRAVVSRNVEVAATPTYVEDEFAEDLQEDAVEAVAEVAKPVTAEAEATEVEAFEAEIEVEELEAEAMAEPEADAIDPVQDSFEAEYEEEYEQDEDAAQGAEVAPEAVAAPIAEETVRPMRPVRVVKMKRTEFEAAIASGQLEAEPEDDEHDSSLSAEDEAELLRELAEVEAELGDEDDDVEDDDVRSIFAAEETAQPRPEAAASLAEPDVSRLLEETQSQLNNPEGTHRRNAIAHLRAAVRATRAETSAGGGLNRIDDSADAYREDLNTVVRPNRPRSTQAESARPKSPLDTPLKLVAEQRVDGPTVAAPAAAVAATTGAQPVTPVRPRRISLKAAPQEQPTPKTNEKFGSFAEFAESVGAEELPELLEAAAAYLSYVEGHDQFSRPQLMSKARQVEEVEFSREDGLRSFGQLLRQGKIEKLKGGRFTVSEQIGFKPSVRAAG